MSLVLLKRTQEAYHIPSKNQSHANSKSIDQDGTRIITKQTTCLQLLLPSSSLTDKTRSPFCIIFFLSASFYLFLMQKPIQMMQINKK